MIGQNHLIDRLNNINSLDLFSHTILLLGEDGCGKHTLSSLIADRFNVPIKDITADISVDLIYELNLLTSPMFFILNLTEITEKQQNTLLKLIEEPSDCCYFLLLAESKLFLLPTIINRCQIWEFKPYTKQELMLSQGLTNEQDNLLNISRTPGRIAILKDYDISSASALAVKLLTKLNIANYANTLSIYSKIPSVDKDSSIYVKIFVDVLLDIISQNILKDTINLNSPYMWYNETLELKKQLYMPKVDCKYLFENYISKMWRKVRECI